MEKLKKLALFIDQANLWGSYKKIGQVIDFNLLVNYVEKEFEGALAIKNIYFAYPGEGTREYNVKGIHGFGVFLKKELGFKVNKKELKRIEVRDEYNNIVHGSNGEPIYREKGNLDVELVMDVMKTIDMFDEMILFSGDSDFQPLISYLIFKGKKVYVFSTNGNASTELMYGSSRYFDLGEVEGIYRNKLRHRNEKP